MASDLGEAVNGGNGGGKWRLKKREKKKEDQKKNKTQIGKWTGTRLGWDGLGKDTHTDRHLRKSDVLVGQRPKKKKLDSTRLDVFVACMKCIYDKIVCRVTGWLITSTGPSRGSSGSGCVGHGGT